MANTYTQLYVHIIFAVQCRESLIQESFREQLYRYIAGTCRERNHLVHAINGTQDHIHMLVGMHPAESVAELVKMVKSHSSRWVNEHHLHGKFAWQSGYGAFTYSKSQLPAVKKYIESQQEHHRKVSFQEEIARIFDRAGIEYEPQYMMQGVE